MQVIDKWGPDVKAKIAAIKECQTKSEASPQLIEERLAILARVETMFLFDGYQDFFRTLVPTDEHFPYVMGHNDPQECNILVKDSERLELVLIDVEYAGWNPMAFDLASFYTETMFQNDCEVSETGTALCLDNMMTVRETTEFARAYLINYFDYHMTKDEKKIYSNAEEFLSKKLSLFVR